jgi:hypothetical protein
MSEAAFPYDVFLSHSAKVKAVVRSLPERLRQDGLKVWFDEWEFNRWTESFFRDQGGNQQASQVSRSRAPSRPPVQIRIPAIAALGSVATKPTNKPAAMSGIERVARFTLS